MNGVQFLAFLICWFMCVSAHGAEPFKFRGYYVTFMRMPVMGLPEWKEAVDCFAEDDINVLILWTAGGFRSKKFPITWQYNQDHANVRNDFARELIDYAHTNNIRVLLGFTPFGYDGVNRYPIEHPELKAKKSDGAPVDEFGIHCWGWNLCPAREESQRFMREYVSEMIFDFYPNADGLLIESSDYNICRCPDCGPKFYEREFAFVKWISEEVWKRKAQALIVVYPHYFTGQNVPGLDAIAARQEFDPRWGLAFSPHSSHFNADLIRKARESFYWSDAPILGAPVASPKLRGLPATMASAVLSRRWKHSVTSPSIPKAVSRDKWVSGAKPSPGTLWPTAECRIAHCLRGPSALRSVNSATTPLWIWPNFSETLANTSSATLPPLAPRLICWNFSASSPSRATGIGHRRSSIPNSFWRA